MNYRDFVEFQKRLDKLAKVDLEKFCEDAAKELTARLLATVIKRTPVGQYKGGKVGGTLRRGWTAGKQHWTETKDGKTRVKGIGGNTGYVQSMNVTKKGDIYEIEVINNVHYAKYVEFGHRTRNLQGWVPGRFMLTISVDLVESRAPQIIEKKLTKLLKDTFER